MRPYVMHVRNMEEDHQGGKVQKKGTFAGTVVFLMDEQSKTVNYGVALCNPKDHYNRKLGYQIALGRAKSQNNNLRTYCFDKPAEERTYEDYLHAAKLMLRGFVIANLKRKSKIVVDNLGL